MDDAVQPGTIDLPWLFETEAQDLILKVQKGALVHQTKNIRDSGGSFEDGFREFLTERLPRSFVVTSGYLFDPGSNCTPQIDIMVVDGQDTHELMRASGSVYIPYPAAQIILEVKNSSINLGKHLAQISAIVNSIAKMRTKTSNFLPSGGPFQSAPLSVLLIGNSEKSKPSDFQKWYDHETRANVTLLLDRGIVIAPVNYFEMELSEGNPTLTMLPSRSSGRWAFWRSREKDYRSGRALQWLYFSMLAHLNFVTRGNMGAIHAFTTQVGRELPLTLMGLLDDAPDWSD